MDIKRIILEEIDDFDWIRDIPAGIPLTGRFRYLINLCDSKYKPNDLRNKFIELFGKEVLSNKNQNYYCNWFNNTHIEEVDNSVYLILKSSDNLYGVEAGWTGCFDDEYINDELSDYVHITPEEFFNFVL